EKPCPFKEMTQPFAPGERRQQQSAALGKGERAPQGRVVQPLADKPGVVKKFLGAVGLDDLDPEPRLPQRRLEAGGAVSPGKVQQARAGRRLARDQRG